MVERSQHLGLTLKAGHALRIAGERLGQDFERHVAFEFDVASAVYLAHAASADRREDLVGSHAGSDRERHCGFIDLIFGRRQRQCETGYSEIERSEATVRYRAAGAAVGSISSVYLVSVSVVNSGLLDLAPSS